MTTPVATTREPSGAVDTAAAVADTGEEEEEEALLEGSLEEGGRAGRPGRLPGACGHCKARLVDPVVLNCLHVFERACLHGYESVASADSPFAGVSCPRCRWPSGSVASLRAYVAEYAERDAADTDCAGERCCCRGDEQEPDERLGGDGSDCSEQRDDAGESGSGTLEQPVATGPALLAARRSRRADKRRADTAGESGSDLLKCVLCTSGEDSQYKCVDCAGLLCERCKALHKEVKFLNCHLEVEPLTDADRADIRALKRHLSDNRPVPCETHADRRYTHYCVQCGALACSRCLTSDHVEHSAVPLAEFPARISPRVAYFTDRCRLAEREGRLAVERINNALQEISTSADENKSLIEEAANEWKTAIDDIKVEFLRRNKELHDELELRAMAAINRAEATVEHIEYALEFSRLYLERCSTVEFCKIVKVVLNCLADLADKQIDSSVETSVPFREGVASISSVIQSSFGMFVAPPGLVDRMHHSHHSHSHHSHHHHHHRDKGDHSSSAGGPSVDPITGVATGLLMGVAPNGCVSLHNGSSLPFDIGPPPSHHALHHSLSTTGAVGTGGTITGPVAGVAGYPLLGHAAAAVGGHGPIGPGPLAHLPPDPINSMTSMNSINSISSINSPDVVSFPFHSPFETRGGGPVFDDGGVPMMPLLGGGGGQARTSPCGGGVPGVPTFPPIDTFNGSMSNGGSGGSAGGGGAGSAGSSGGGGASGAGGVSAAAFLRPGSTGYNPNPRPPFPNRGNQCAAMTVKARWGSLGSGRGEMSSPHGFCLGFSEEIVVADTQNHRIQIFTKDGQFLSQFGVAGRDEGQLWFPRKVAIIRSTQRYVVCDRGNERSRMQIFGRSGHFLRKISIRYIDIVAGLAVNNMGHIVAVDSVSPSVFVVSEGGELIKWFDCSSCMREPSDIAVHGDEYFICDFKGHCVCVFKQDGTFVQRFGNETITNFPNGIDVSDHGDVLIGDSHGNRFHIAVYSHDGKLMSEFECPSVKVSRACGLKITSEGYLVTLAKNNHHVLVMDTLYIS